MQDPGLEHRETWATRPGLVKEPLDWEDLSSEETNAAKAFLDGAASAIQGLIEGGMGLGVNFITISPNYMGCAGFPGLPCNDPSNPLNNYKGPI